MGTAESFLVFSLVHSNTEEDLTYFLGSFINLGKPNINKN